MNALSPTIVSLFPLLPGPAQTRDKLTIGLPSLHNDTRLAEIIINNVYY